jgi:hypothetical protein
MGNSQSGVFEYHSSDISDYYYDYVNDLSDYYYYYDDYYYDEEIEYDWVFVN